MVRSRRAAGRSGELRRGSGGGPDSGGQAWATVELGLRVGSGDGGASVRAELELWRGFNGLHWIQARALVHDAGEESSSTATGR
ncbi:hypothetical protein E2562_029917 [Oryza meyeriana var. granulata]|uniref:Uncharacterized protein n=1 Tax=Oryza meyeriana var. granulata TaxID=110450 RepID=A0A6G1CUQ7_9ORYZ|nr:hypothetical protein E2562_029917 [Oryza meyeriana var. granulata]